MFKKKKKDEKAYSYFEMVNAALIEQNKKGYMNDSVEKELYNIICDSNYIIGIHRTGYTRIDDNVLNDIFNNGLYSNGHVLSGGITGMYDIEKTVSIYDNFAELCVNIKQCHGYKISEGCIVFKIPKELKNSNQLFYTDDNNRVRILPEFIYGYIPVKNMRVDSIVHNPNYKDFHVSLADKYNILFNAYRDTYIKYGYNQAISALLNYINSNNANYFSGAENRNRIINYINNSDVIKIIAYGLNVDSNDINDLFNLFNLSVLNSVEKNSHQVK